MVRVTDFPIAGLLGIGFYCLVLTARFDVTVWCVQRGTTILANVCPMDALPNKKVEQSGQLLQARLRDHVPDCIQLAIMRTDSFPLRIVPMPPCPITCAKASLC